MEMPSGKGKQGDEPKKKHPFHGASICKPKHRSHPRTVDEYTTGDWVAIALVVALSIVCIVLLGIFLSKNESE
jgi:hypothetical protein